MYVATNGWLAAWRAEPAGKPKVDSWESAAESEGGGASGGAGEGQEDEPFTEHGLYASAEEKRSTPVDDELDQKDFDRFVATFGTKEGRAEALKLATQEAERNARQGYGAGKTASSLLENARSSLLEVDGSGRGARVEL